MKHVLSILFFAVLMAGGDYLAGCSTRAADGRIVPMIRKQMARPARGFQRATIDDDDIQPLLRRFYKKRSHQPAWVHASGPTADARELLRELARAPEHGLDPANYDLARLTAMMDGLHERAARDADRDAMLATLDVELSRNFLKVASHRSAGQVNPLQLPADWHIRPRKVDMVLRLEDAIERHRVTGVLDGLDPSDPQYRPLREALARYRKIAAEGGWPVVPGGRLLRRGTSGERVRVLQQRLAAEGDLGHVYARGRFDAATDEALRSFQQRYGLEPDGLAGPEDLTALNRPVSYRIRQIRMNLERRRWVPDSLVAGRYLEVNIPAFSLRVVEHGHAVLALRAVVGRQFTPTPMFADEISYLVFNPYWNVPPRIASQEIVAAMRSDPSYLERRGMKLYENASGNAREVDARRVDWDWMRPEDFHYAVRQEPGPQNAVGHVKFMCPNQYDVYLHDTPSGHLFEAQERGFSHGCIRIEKPAELAAYLLRGKTEWSRDRIAAALDGSLNRAVTIPEPLPIHIVYWTAFTDDHGRMQFRDDFYGLDGLVDRSLRSWRPDIVSMVR